MTTPLSFPQGDWDFGRGSAHTFTLTNMVSAQRTRRSMVLALFIFAFNYQSQALAAECVSKTCVDVYIENGKIIIEGRKGSAKKATPKVKRKVISVAPVVPVVPVVPKSETTTTGRARVVVAPKKITPRRRIYKKPARKAVSVSLSDKLVKLLPTASIAKQPEENALVNVAVIYWCDLPTIFRTKVSVVGEVVDVTMRPAFLWSFGDGAFFATTHPGAPYPRQTITHTYSRAGTYLVTMLATWGGTWTHNGMARAISGQIRKVSFVTLSVANGPTRITQ